MYVKISNGTQRQHVTVELLKVAVGVRVENKLENNSAEGKERDGVRDRERGGKNKS